jgi:Leucine-rich repeat (LRR) protein
LYQLNELETLDLSNNALQIIPLNYSQAKSLIKLDLRGNPFYKWHLKQIKEKISVKELLVD